MPSLNLQDNPRATKLFLIETKDVSTHSHSQIFETLKFKGKYKQIVFLPESREVYVGITFTPATKTIDPFSKVHYFELGAQVIRQLESSNVLELQIENFPTMDSKNLFDFVLGMYQAAWSFDIYLSPNSAKTRNISVSIVQALQSIVGKDFNRMLEALYDGMILARRVVDDTPEAIQPKSMVDIVHDELSRYEKVNVEVIDYAELEKLGMEGITFVGRASRYKPALVHVTISPSKPVQQKVCLVGKGLTFDSGGYNIKPNGGLEMKADMAGSATMLGVSKVLAQLDLEYTEVHWLSAFAENLIDGSGFKPDDILTTYSGQTVEVLNTDAEGRLTLADVLTYATLLNPDYIIDAATLTGAAVVAVSEHYTALMGNDYELTKDLLHVFEQEGEPTVHTQLTEVLRSTVKGGMSDLINTSTIERQAGHITAGLFLSHFVDQNFFRNPKLGIESPKAFPWVHLDIAPSAFNNKKNQLQTKGATGQSIRSLVSWVLSLDLKK